MIVRLTFLVVLSCFGSCRSQSVVGDDNSSSIILINVGSYDKGKIAKQIDILNLLQPRVMALDIEFPEYSGDKVDNDLVAALEKVENVILPSRIHNSGKDYFGKDIITVVGTCELPLAPIAVKEGFVSAKIENSQDAGQIPAQFAISQKDYTGEVYYHFSYVIAMCYDSVRAIKYLQQQQDLVNVNFVNDKRYNFKIISGQDLLEGKVMQDDIADKIVIMGFLGPGNEDKFVSPFNNKKNGEPDMYGVEYLAHIVAQILNLK